MYFLSKKYSENGLWSTLLLYFQVVSRRLSLNLTWQKSCQTWIHYSIDSNSYSDVPSLFRLPFLREIFFDAIIKERKKFHSYLKYGSPFGSKHLKNICSLLYVNSNSQWCQSNWKTLTFFQPNDNPTNQSELRHS